MANLFGDVVDNHMLKKMPKYAHGKITQEDRALEARNLEDAGNKSADAISYVESLKKIYGRGASTLCLVYNSTGDSISLVTSHDWHGHIGTAPYPVEIGNGQWAAFLHVHSTAAATGSVAGVVYRANNILGQNKDCLVSWCTPWGLQSNSAYCEIGDVNHFSDDWDNKYKKLDKSKYFSQSKAGGCEIEARSEKGSSPTFTAKITSR